MLAFCVPCEERNPVALRADCLTGLEDETLLLTARVGWGSSREKADPRNQGSGSQGSVPEQEESWSIKTSS